MHRCLIVGAKYPSFNDFATKVLHALVGFFHLSVLPRFSRLALFLPGVTTLISLLLITLPHQFFAYMTALAPIQGEALGEA